MAHVPAQYVLEGLYFRPLVKSERTLGVLAVNVHDYVQRGDARSYSKLARMVNNHFKQKQREKTHCST